MTTFSSTRSRLAALVMLGAAAIAGLLATSAGPSRAATPPPAKQLTDGFLDHNSGAYLRLQLDPNQPRYGSFVAAVPGVGLIWPTGAADVVPNSSHDTQLRYDSNGYVDHGARLDPEFGVDYHFTGTQTSALVRLIGHIDPAHHTGVAELWVDGKHFQLVAQGDPSHSNPADGTVKAVLGAYRAQDWTSLYKLTDTSLTTGQSVQQFTALLTSGLAGGHITAAQTTGPVAYTTTSAGTTFAQVPVTLTQTSTQGTSQNGDATMQLIDDTGGVWHLLTLS